MVISCFSFTEVAKRAIPLMQNGGSLLTLSYGGATKSVPSYNVMGVAKAALEASVRYLAADLGPQNIRVNALSAGPMRTLSGAGVSDARVIFNFQKEHAPLKRTPTLNEVGGSALYLLVRYVGRGDGRGAFRRLRIFHRRHAEPRSPEAFGQRGDCDAGRTLAVGSRRVEASHLDGRTLADHTTRMIGVFDSGLGGLTVLRALVARFPNEPFIYLGDHANVPYGNRSSAEVIDLTRACVEALFARGCKLVLLGCNTATAVAARHLQQNWLPTSPWRGHNVLGIVAPTVEAATQTPWAVSSPQYPQKYNTDLIAVFGTTRTINSDAYPEEIRKRCPRVTVVQQICAQLVGAIEDEAPEAELERLVEEGVRGAMEQTERDAAAPGDPGLYPLPAGRAPVPPPSAAIHAHPFAAGSRRRQSRRLPRAPAALPGRQAAALR